MHKNSADKNTEFVRLLTKHQQQLYLYIISFLPNPADVDDVLQATNLVLWAKVDDFAPGTDFGAWARRVAYFEILAFWKRERRRRLVFDSGLIDVMAAEWEGANDGLETRRQALSCCLNKLRANDRDLLTWRYGSSKTVNEIASQVSRPTKSIYRSLERVRMALLECIRRQLAIGGTP